MEEADEENVEGEWEEVRNTWQEDEGVREKVSFRGVGGRSSYLFGVRIKSILDVAFSHHTKMLDRLDGNGT